MYTASRNDAALDQLTRLYGSFILDEHRRVAAGLEALFRRLEADPFAVGEARGGPARIVFPDMLVVRFRVDPAARTVRLTGVRRFDP
jgi:hypothetical protein